MTAPAGPAPTIAPPWLLNLAALGWRLIVIAALVFAAWQLATLLSTVTASIAVAVVVAASFAPFALRLRARGHSRTGAAAIVWVVALLVIGGTLLLLGIALVPYLGTLLGLLVEGVEELQATLAEAGVPPVVGELAAWLADWLRSVLTGAAADIASTAASVVTVAILATFLVFFFLQDGDKAWVWVFQATSDRKRDQITTAGDDALIRVGGYLRGTTVLSGIVAITDYVFMLLLGVPLAAPLAMFAFLSGYIPYFGGIVTTIVILAITWAALGTGPLVAMLLLIVGRNAILAYGVRPRIYGRAVHLHPALVLVALPAGYQLAGIVGLFAAVPVAAVIIAVSQAVVAILDPGPRPELPALVPAWLDRVAQWSWRLLVAAGLCALLVGLFVAVPLVLVPVVLALIFAATLRPMVLGLERRGWGRGAAAAVAVLGTTLAIALIMVLAALALADQGQGVEQATTSGAEGLSSASGGHLDLVVSAVSTGGETLVATLRTVASTASSIVIATILSILLSFYFLRDGASLWAKLTGRLRPEAAGQIDAAGTRAIDVLGGYMVGTGAVSLVGAGSQLLIMLVLGLPLAFPIFVLSFFLCFIPYIGGFISTGLAFLVAVAFGSTSDIVVMAIWTLVFNIVQGNVISPLVYGRTVHLHPAVVIVACPAGAAIAGMLGMFLVVPALGIVAATWRSVVEIIGMPRTGPAPAIEPVVPGQPGP